MRRVSRRTILAYAGVVYAGMAVMMPALQLRGAFAEPARLALKGFDPVAYFTLGRAVSGNADLEYEWDEQRYRFSHADHLALFKADPVRYLPRFANLCAMSLARGEIVEANPEYWLVADGKLYLFGQPKGVHLFQQNTAENIGKANDNRTLLPKR